MQSGKKLLVFFADLAHNYFKVNQYTPTGIGYLAAYSKSKLGNKEHTSAVSQSVSDMLSFYLEENPSQEAW